MPRPDLISVTVELSGEVHSAADLGEVVQALDGLVTAAAWGQLASRGRSGGASVAAFRILLSARRRDKAYERFFPQFGDRSELREEELTEESQVYYPSPEDFEGFDPTDPLDAGLRYGLNSFLRKLLRSQNPALHSRLFDVASITRAEHNSPLLIELTLAVTAVTLMPAVIVVAASRAALAHRKGLAQAEILEKQRDLLKEDLKQKKLQTRILERIADAVDDLDARDMPPEAMAAAAKIVTTPVADLGSSPLIGSVALGLSSKAS